MAAGANILRTGLYPPGIAIGYELHTELSYIEALFAAEHRPATPTERSLVDSIVHYEWMLRRYRWLETDLWKACWKKRCTEQLQASPYGFSFRDEPALPHPRHASRHAARPQRDPRRAPPHQVRRQGRASRRLPAGTRVPSRSRPAT